MHGASLLRRHPRRRVGVHAAERLDPATGLKAPSGPNHAQLPPGWRSETRTVPGTDGAEPQAITCCVNELGMDFVQVPPGEFMMGSQWRERGAEAGERPQHQVRITRAFYMGAHEVTQEQYARVMGTTRRSTTAPGSPVESVSWDDAVEFCARLSKDGCDLPPADRGGVGIRLPRRQHDAYCFGDDPDGLGDYAWYINNSGEQTHPVGLKKPNAWGLYDMSMATSGSGARTGTAATGATSPWTRSARTRGPTGSCAAGRGSTIRWRCAAPAGAETSPPTGPTTRASGWSAC